MRQPTFSGIVKRRFLHCTRHHHQPVRTLVQHIGVPPGDLCRIITGQSMPRVPLSSYWRVARWLRMPLANAVALAGITPRIEDLVRLGMEARNYNPTSTRDQEAAAQEVGISVAVFRRALHGYADFRPSVRTCDRLAGWLGWTGLDTDDIALATGMVMRYRSDGNRVTVGRSAQFKPYPCACGRAGCMVPAHIPSGPHRKWRSDACRMWARRKAAREARASQALVTAAPPDSPPLPQRDPIVRFIMINERPVPVRF